MAKLHKFVYLYEKSMTPISMKTLLDSGSGRLLGRSSSVADSKFMAEHQGLKGMNREKELKRLARVQIASFLRREMPVRFAHRIRDLENLPHGLNNMTHIKSVQNDYIESCEEVLSIEENFEDDSQFRKIMAHIYSRHSDTLIEVARGLQEFKKLHNQELSEISDIHTFLDRFFLSRIGIRVLIGHYLELHNQADNPGNYNENYIGLINLKTSTAEVCKAASQDAQYMCTKQYGDAPEVEILGRTDLTFAYVPSHLYYILFELLKNSLRAVAEFHSKAKVLPKIRVIIADSETNEDVCIKISDQGGGIARSHLKKIFSYLFTTAVVGEESLLDGLEDFGRENPLAGLGYGLPISRLYLRYFNGDLELKSMEGYGSDAFVHLSRLTDNEEPLP